jgi:hypothetical protein
MGGMFLGKEVLQKDVRKVMQKVNAKAEHYLKVHKHEIFLNFFFT